MKINDRKWRENWLDHFFDTMAPMDWNCTGYPLHCCDYLKSCGAKNRRGKRKEKKKIDVSYHHSTLQFSSRQKCPQFANTDHKGKQEKGK